MASRFEPSPWGMRVLRTNLLPRRIRPDRETRLVLSRLREPTRRAVSGAFSAKIVLEGEEHYRVGGQRHRLVRGEMLLFRPGVEFTFETPPEHHARGVCLHVDPEELAGHHGKGSPDALRLPMEGSPLGRAMERAGRLLAESPGGSSWDLASLPGRLGDLLAQVETLASRVDASRDETRFDLVSRLERARFLVESRFLDDLSLADLAGAAALSIHHFSRLFRALYGLPPLRFRDQLRLDWAREEIAAGRLTPGQAARRLGYVEAASFTRAFRRRHGIPPSRAARTS